VASEQQSPFIACSYSAWKTGQSGVEQHGRRNARSRSNSQRPRAPSWVRSTAIQKRREFWMRILKGRKESADASAGCREKAEPLNQTQQDRVGEHREGKTGGSLPPLLPLVYYVRTATAYQEGDFSTGNFQIMTSPGHKHILNG